MGIPACLRRYEITSEENRMRDDLKLPTIRAQRNQSLFPRRSLKIEELLNFMEFNLKHTVNIKAVRKSKHKYSVSLPFHLG